MARGFISNAAERLEERISPEMIDEKLELLRRSTEAILGRTEKLVKRHPFYAIAGAAAVGAALMGYLGLKLKGAAK